jgi:hypothetical protein
MKRLFTLAALSSFSVLLAACDGGSTTSEPNIDEGTPDAGSTTPDDVTTPDAGATPTDVGCPTAHFLDVSKAPGPGSSYPKPTLAVSCTETTMVVTSNGIPHYTFVQITPNALAAQNHSWTVPRHPQKASQTTDIPVLGGIGFSVSGLPIYGPTEGPAPVGDGYGDPIYNGILDDCLGHTGRAGAYHNHALLEQCLTERGLVAEPGKLAAPTGDEASPVLGYSFDGFPIYGSYECADPSCINIRKVESSWDMTGDPRTLAWEAYTYSEKTGAGALDRCNGHTGPAGDYHYHATDGFPYVLGCYTGTPSNSSGRP